LSVPLTSLTDYPLGVSIGDTNRSPDFSIGIPEIEHSEFLIGEVGYSDSGNLIRRRVIKWLSDALGKVCQINTVGFD